MPIRSRVALIIWALALLGAGPSGAQIAQTEYIGSYTWTSKSKIFGGFSGIEVSDDGTKFIAIGDRGIFAKGGFSRHNGTITAVNANITRIKQTDGNPVTAIRSDAEGLAMRADGRIYISFEHIPRLWTYKSTNSEAAWLPRHPEFKKMVRNSSLEALAIAPDGALYTMPEIADNNKNSFSIYRYKNGAWSIPFQISKRGSFLPVGADFGPDGKFYLLERHLGSIFGFETRVRRFAFNAGKFQNEQIILQTPAGTHDNLEGLAVWQDQQGHIRLTMIADDNFNFFQSTEIVEYRIKE